ncbi:MAG: response regulator [Chloroflexota bacterium]|nr:response regulator [Chloroflexota bacterium]
MEGKRILAVEDRETLLTAIRDILEMEGYTVVTAADGLEALQLMEETPPDLIVADIMMPRMDGHDLYREIRARPEWVRIPFIFLTAKAEQEDILKGKGMGAEDYLTKPFDPQELVVAVRARLKRAQSIQQATQAEFDQLKQQIITVLGHELRTPLTYVLGYTDLALEDLSSLSSDELEGLLLGVKQGADRLALMVEDLLLLIRLDSGQAADEFRTLAQIYADWEMVVESAVREQEERAAANGVTLEIALPSDLPPVRVCKPFLMDALGRLLDNAIKFSSDEGKLVTVSVRRAGAWAEIAVQDEGVGISAKEIPHLFERFRQIDREAMEQQGRGLGLAITQELIRLHGGEVAVESELGAGSTFTIRLPVAEQGDFLSA